MSRGLLFVFALLFQYSISANAALGDQVVVAHARSSQGISTLSTASGASYTISESTLNGNIKVKEYTDASGLVFAVSWRGPVVPDLPSVLGGYASEFKAVRDKQRKVHGRRVVRFQTEHIVVEGSGHMRDQGGRAYIPTSLPAGFNLEDIQYNE